MAGEFNNLKGIKGINLGGVKEVDIGIHDGKIVYQREKSYLVTFNSNNTGYGTVAPITALVKEGSVLSTATSGRLGMVRANGIDICTATPTSNTSSYTYALNSWTGASGTITEPKTITANFTRSAVTPYHTVEIKSNDISLGTVSTSSMYVAQGSSINTSGNTLTIQYSSCTATPTASPTPDTLKHRFSSWSNASGNITGPRTITANFATESKKYVPIGTLSVSAPNGSYATFSNSDPVGSSQPSYVTGATSTKETFVSGQSTSFPYNGYNASTSVSVEMNAVNQVKATVSITPSSWGTNPSGAGMSVTYSFSVYKFPSD